MFKKRKKKKRGGGGERSQEPMRFDTLPMGATCHQVSFHSDTTVKMAQKTQNVMGGEGGGGC